MGIELYPKGYIPPHLAFLGKQVGAEPSQDRSDNVVSDEMRALIEEEWPELVHKLLPASRRADYAGQSRKQNLDLRPEGTRGMTSQKTKPARG